MIHKEHYRDFIGTLSAKIETINAEISTLNSDDDFEFWEICGLRDTINLYENTSKYFDNDSRRANFDSLLSLESYVEATENHLKSTVKYITTVLPEDGCDLVGITQEEWDTLDTYSWELRKKVSAWKLFLEFCTTGKVE